MKDMNCLLQIVKIDENTTETMTDVIKDLARLSRWTWLSGKYGFRAFDDGTIDFLNTRPCELRVAKSVFLESKKRLLANQKPMDSRLVKNNKRVIKEIAEKHPYFEFNYFIENHYEKKTTIEVVCARGRFYSCEVNSVSRSEWQRKTELPRDTQGGKMRIIKVTDDCIRFSNGFEITCYFEQECSESNYADFSQLEDSAWACEFPEVLTFEKVEGSGFRFGGEGTPMFFIPCYSYQNGYYCSNIDIYYNETKVFSLPCEEKIVD